ncbi:hypothetical protein EDD17DRAFT_1782578 [Pisolithus thermaeus]|nr:hypothetical protein EV401DRAFT_2060234 [Pisolithus croceorrhizus]KAI6139250.1 hypothetical protein EDD17DRAFT_1782578 [Pisolithus thermaeus]
MQLQVILWGLSILNVSNIPSTWVLKDIDNSLQSQYRIPSVCYQGALGHIYYVNYLPSIIAQEMANPCVHPHIHHYPEDAGSQLDQPWQASRWLCEIDPTITTPMICKAWQDFYVFELMKLMDGTMVVPEHWYTKPAPQNSPHFDFEYWACVWRAHPVTSSCTHGYVIHAYDIVEVSSPLLSMHPPNLSWHGVLPWTLTDPTVGNGWHVWAQGHHVLSYMIWLYCDNTSGNMSKKWNKHNSFLFTATGLPHVMVHKESSIHFLAMSNIVPPLEMLDGIVDQLE